MATNYDNPSIYVADLKAYNEGKLIGEWVDLTEFDEGYEVMEKISDLMDGYSKKYHNGMETEYAIHDFENFSRELYSESMGEEDFDIILKTHKISDERDIPAEVLQDVMARYDSASKDIEGFIDDRYRGQFDTETDFAYDYVDMVGGIENLGKNDIDMYFDYASFGSDYVTNYIDIVDGHYFDSSYKKGGKIKTHDLKKYMKRGGGIYPQSDIAIITQFSFDELISQKFGQNPFMIIGKDVIYPINTENGVEEIVVERFKEYDSAKDVVNRIEKQSMEGKFAKGGKLKSFFSKAKEVGGKAYAKGKEKAKEIAHNTKEAIKESKHNQVVNHTLKALYETRKWDYGATDEEKTHLNRAEHIINEKYLFEPTPYVPTNTELKAKGGDIAFLPTPMMDNFHRNIMGTLSFDMQVKPMRKAQDFIVYPMKTLEEYLHIQSNKKFGYIRLEDGKGILSKGNGNTSWHLRRDMEMRNVIRFELTSSQLEELKFMLKQTSGSKVGSSVVFSDNSGVSMLESGGYLEGKTYYIVNYYSSESDIANGIALKNKSFDTKEDANTFLKSIENKGGKGFVTDFRKPTQDEISKLDRDRDENYMMAKGGSMKNSILNGGTIFAKGKEGRYHILGVPKSEPMAKPSFHSSVHDHSEIKQAVARARKDLKDLTNKEYEIFVTDDKEDREIYNYAKGGDISDKQYLDSLAEERFKLGRARRIERIANIHEYLANYKTPSEKRYFDVFDKKLNKILAQNNASFIDDVSDISEIAKLERLYDKLILQDIRGYAKGGLVNKEFLSNQTSDYTNRILQSIADYYGTTKSKIQRELYDDDAEMIYEYIGNDSGLRRLVYEQMENFKNRNNYKKGGNVKDKVERTDLIVYYPNIDYSMGSPNYINELECSVYAKEEHHLRGQIDDCLNNIGVYNSQILGYKVIGANPYNYEDDLRAVLRLNEMRGFYDKGESARKFMTGDSATFGAFAKGGGIPTKFYWIEMDRDKIDEYIDYASRMRGLFENEIYTQGVNRVAFVTDDDRFSFTSMIENHNNDNDLNEGDEGYIFYKELYGDKAMPNIFDKISRDNYAKGGMTKSMEVEEVMQDHFAKGGTFPNNFMVSAYDVSYNISYDNGGGSSNSLIYDGYEDYDRNGDLIYDVEDSYNEALKEYNKISEKMFYEGDVVDYVELTALGEYKDLDDDDLNNFGFTILNSKGTSPFDRKRKGEFAEGGRVLKPYFDATAYEYRHNGMYGDSKKFSTEMEAIDWGLKQFQSRKDDVQKVEIHRARPNSAGGFNFDKVFHIDETYPLGRRVVSRMFDKGGDIKYNDVLSEILAEKGYELIDIHQGNKLSFKERENIRQEANTKFKEIHKRQSKSKGFNKWNYAKGGEIDGQTFRSAVIWAEGDIHENFNYEETDLDIQHDLMSDHTELYKASNTFGIRDYDTWREIYEIAFEDMGIENPPQFAKGGFTYAEGGKIPSKIKDAVSKSKNLMDVGNYLKESGVDYDFNTYDMPMPPAMYKIKEKVDGKSIYILNKNYVDGADFINGEIAIGIMAKGGGVSMLERGGDVGKNITYSATFDLMDADGNNIDNPMPSLQFDVSSNVSYGDARDLAQRTYEGGNFFEEGMKAVMTDFWMGEMDADEEDRKRVEVQEEEEREEFVPRVERSGKWDSSYSVLCDELATYEQGGSTDDGKQKVSGVAYYITNKSVDNAYGESRSGDMYDYENLSQSQLDSKEEFESLLDDEVILEFGFDVFVKYDWQIVQAIYEQMAQKKMYGNNEHIIGFALGFNVSDDFSSSLPYNIDEDEYYEKGGEVIDTFTSIQGSQVMPNNPFTIEKENDFYVIKNSKGEVLAKDTTKDGIMKDKGMFLNLYAKGGWLENSIFDSEEEALADYEQYTYKHRFTKGITAKVIGITNSGVKIRVTEENDWNENKLRKPRKRTFALPIRDFMETYKLKYGDNDTSVEQTPFAKGGKMAYGGNVDIGSYYFKDTDGEYDHYEYKGYSGELDIRAEEDYGDGVDSEGNKMEGYFFLDTDTGYTETFDTESQARRGLKKYMKEVGYKVVSKKKFYELAGWDINDDYAKGGSIKGRNNKSGETFGVVIGSKEFTDDDKDRISLNVRSGYSSRISERKLVFDTNGNLIETLDYGYTLDGSNPNTNGGSGRHIGASNKKETIDAMVDLGYNKGFANKVIEFVKE